MADLYFTVKSAHQKLSKDYAEVTPSTGMHLITATILDSFCMLGLFRKWDNWMDIKTQDEGCYSTKYQEAFWKFVENEECAKHRHLPNITPRMIPITSLCSSVMASRSGQSSYDPCDEYSDDAEYKMTTNVAETTPGRSNCAAP